MRTAKTIMSLLMSAMLMGCATAHEETRIFRIPPGQVVLTDDFGRIGKACNNVVGLGIVVGCYQPRTQTIFCPPSDMDTCGHELLHHVGLKHDEFHNH